MTKEIFRKGFVLFFTFFQGVFFAFFIFVCVNETKISPRMRKNVEISSKLTTVAVLNWRRVKVLEKEIEKLKADDIGNGEKMIVSNLPECRL